MFIKQHYKAIAEIVNNARKYTLNYHNPDARWEWKLDEQQLVSELADYFAQDNPNFDREKFLEACGL